MAINEHSNQEYWEQRLSNRLDLSTVGHNGLGYIYNYWLYQARFRAMQRALKKLKIDFSGKFVIEAGVGSGAWLPFWKRHNISTLVGLDITTVSVRTLKQKYPEFSFLKWDISTSLPPLKENSFDAATAFDILFHITDDTAFTNAVINLTKLIRPRGIFIVSDSFCETASQRSLYEYHRSYKEYSKILESAGMEIIHYEPIFFMLSTTLCGLHTKRYSILGKSVQLIHKLVSKLAFRKHTNWLNHLIGFSLYLIDGLIGLFVRTSPSVNILIARKTK